MLELLVASLCLGGYQCNRAFEAYYQSKPQLRQQVRTYKQALELKLGPQLVYTLPALGALIGGHSARLKLGRQVYLDVQTGATLLIYKKEF